MHSLSDEVEGVPEFELDEGSDLVGASLLILDECSMVDGGLGRDVLSFGVPVLVLGDPMQLPPIQREGFFDGEPDVMLMEIHRQARDDPIIAMASIVREGGRLKPGRYGGSEVFARGTSLPAGRVLRADQILIGRNATRLTSNARVRELRGFREAAPWAGEQLVCLKNDRGKGLLNGELWSVESLTRQRGTHIGLEVLSDDGAVRTKVKVRPEFFEGTEDGLKWAERRDSDEFTYGYVLTVHKAQGSQWNDVVLFDESFAFANTARATSTPA